MDSLVQFGKDGLRIKGEKIVPMCAEFHYWRVEPRWWDDILGRLIKGAEMPMVASYIPWSFHEKIRGDFDFTGRRDPRANLKGFLDLVHKNGLYFVARSGPICLGEIDGIGPPDYANVIDERAGGRSQEFLDLTEAWVEAVSAVWKEYSIHNGGPLILVQVDNEIWPTPSRLKTWLMDRYETIQDLNAVWERSYRDFDEAAADKEVYDGKKMGDSYASSMGSNWKSCLDIMEYKTRFFTRDYAERMVAMFERHGTDVPLFTNNTFPFLQDWYEVQKAVTFVGVDHYAYYLIPGDSYYWDYIYISLNNNVSNFPWSPEYQCGSCLMMFGPATSQHQRLVTFFALAAGMTGMNYYMFVERERWEGFCPVTETGKIREEWFAHRQMFRILKEVNWPNLDRQCAVGLLWHQEHYWEFLHEGGRIIQPDDYTVVGSKDYEHLAQEPFWLYIKALIDTDTDFDVVDVRTDLSKYEVLIYAAPPFLDRAIQEKLVDYVKQGGKIVFLSPPPHLDVAKEPCSLLMDGLEIVRGTPANRTVALQVDGQSCSVHLSEHYGPSDGEPVLTAADGTVCAHQRRIGKGSVVQVGFSALDEEVLRTVLRAVQAPQYVQADQRLVQTSLHWTQEEAVVIAINRDDREQTARIHVIPEFGTDRDAEELFRRERLVIGENQTVTVTIPAHEVAVIQFGKKGTERIDLNKDQLIQGYFERVG
ncbi:MAG: alpha-amylase family protein [Candidatus Latescibacterota bacterium]